MANGGVPYYKVDTNRYEDIRIKKLKKDCGATGVAIYDYILCQIYGGSGYYIVENEELIFNVSDYLNVKRQNVLEVISYACSVGLFNKELRASESILTSASIQKRWYFLAKHGKRSLPSVMKKYRLLPDNYVVQQMADVAQQTDNAAQQMLDVAQQSVKVAQQTPNVVQPLRNIQTKTETEKENPPYNPPIIEKEKERNIYKGGEPEIFDESDVEEVEDTNPHQPILSPSEKKAKAIEARKKREQDFYNELVPFVEQYGAEMIRAFYEYWIEPNKSGTKMRKDMEATWCLERRLGTWNRNSKSFKNGRNSSTSQGEYVSPADQARQSYARIKELCEQRII